MKEGLINNKTIIKINLSRNNIKNEGCEILIDIIEKNNSLNKINLESKYLLI
jgi:Ran GTPase-activating protein (RanGAP) involved in mRNA processing and transport